MSDCRFAFDRSGRSSSRPGLFFATLTGLACAAALAAPEASAKAGPGGSMSAGGSTAPAGSAPGVDARSAQRRVILITGSTSGLGRELALRLGSTGAHVLVHGRDRERGREVVEAIEEEGEGSARFYAADLASYDEVRELADAVLRDYDRLDLLINNAGIGSSSPEGRHVSDDGHELRFQVNYLSHFLLTRLLLDRIVESAPARIINVSSGAQTPIDFDDVMLEDDYSGSRAYAQSKLAQVMFTIDLADELEGTGVFVGSLHPATYMDTRMVRRAGVEPRSTVDEGAEAVLNLVESDDLESGQYFNRLEPARAHDQAYDEEARARLRELSRELTGLN